MFDVNTKPAPEPAKPPEPEIVSKWTLVDYDNEEAPKPDECVFSPRKSVQSLSRYSLLRAPRHATLQQASKSLVSLLYGWTLGTIVCAAPQFWMSICFKCWSAYGVFDWESLSSSQAASGLLGAGSLGHVACFR